MKRVFWLQRIEKEWRRHSVLWLYGVRRVGKTVLAQSLDRVEYFDCELPSVRRAMEDPESFLSRLKGKRIVLDEMHRLSNPSELLKIAADHYPQVRVLATGSSTLAATSKFRDSLAGRKSDLWITPMIQADLEDFNRGNLEDRLFRGGLPPFFLSPDYPESEFQSWMDAYWAKDIQELFRLQKHSSFQRFLELLFLQSGGIFEATSFAGPCEANRMTIQHYLDILQITRTAHVIRPFSRRRSSEIISAPKVYAFDTGFISYYRGWKDLREEDKGILWEHYVLNEIQGDGKNVEVRYWRDKRGHEVDFVILKRGEPPIAVECKWSANRFDPASLKSFRTRYPEGENWIVAQDVRRPYQRKEGGFDCEFLGVRDMRELL